MSETNQTTTVFDLFRDEHEYTIKDQRGRSATIVLRALSYGEQIALWAEVEKARQEADKQYDTPEFRAQAERESNALTPEAIIDRLILIERVTASQNADLAPAGAGAAPEKKTLEQWEAERRAELVQADKPVLISMLVDRGVRTAVAAKGQARISELSIVASVRDPRTGVPMFSLDAKAPNFFNGLMARMRDQVIAAFNDFVMNTEDKRLRELVETTPFLPSGESANSPVDTRGETTEILSPSPQVSSEPTPSATG